MEISDLSSIIQNFQLILSFHFNYLNKTILGTITLEEQKNQKFCWNEQNRERYQNLSYLKATKVTVLPKK